MIIFSFFGCYLLPSSVIENCRDYKLLYFIVCRLQDNGGKPISHYVVEKKDKKSGKWSPVSKFCRTPECDVTGLDEGEEYEFRVAAVNEQGQSDPLTTLKPIIAKHPFGKLSTQLLLYVTVLWTHCILFISTMQP